MKTKLIPIILLMLIVIPSSHGKQKSHAEYETFTNKQIADHLGMAGGNWTVTFDESVYLCFILTETDRDGDQSTKQFISSEPTKKHDFHYVHTIEGETLYNENNHEVQFGSFQFLESEPSDIIQVGKGDSTGYAFAFPSSKVITRTFENPISMEPGAAQLLFLISSEETKRSFKLEIIFTVEKIEPVGSGQPM